MRVDPSKTVDCFLRGLGRREWALRVVETGGIGLLVAAVAALAMVAVWAGRHQPAQGRVMALLAAGALGGAAVGLFRRPGKLRLAEEADRQLHLPELLSSAAMLPIADARDDIDRVLRRALAQRAADVCTGKSRPRIRLAKFGRNGWAAIALMAGAPVLLATLISPAAPARPTVGDDAQAVAAADRDDAPIVQLADTAAGPRQELNPDEAVRSGPPAGDYGAATPLANPTPSDNTGGHIAPPLGSTPSGGAAGNATGAGNAHTNVSQPPAPTPTDLTAMQTPPPASSGTPAGGVGPAAIRPPGPGSSASAGGVGRVVDAVRPPPWQTAGWPAEADAARRQADTGQIPAAYVELVRDYFSPDND